MRALPTDALHRAAPPHVLVVGEGVEANLGYFLPGDVEFPQLRALALPGTALNVGALREC